MFSVTNSSHFGTNNKRTFWSSQQQEALKGVFFFFIIVSLFLSFFLDQVNEGFFFLVLYRMWGLQKSLGVWFWQGDRELSQGKTNSCGIWVGRTAQHHFWDTRRRGRGRRGNVKRNLSVFNGLVSHVLANGSGSSRSPARYSLGLSFAEAWAVPRDESPGVRRELWCHGEGAWWRKRRRRTRARGRGCSAKTHPWVSITHSHHSGAE